MQYRGLSSRLWLSLRNMIFIAWGRLNWNIVHWVNGLGMNKMLIKMHPSARWPPSGVRQMHPSNRSSNRISFILFSASNLHLLSKIFNCSETYIANVSPAPVGLYKTSMHFAINFFLPGIYWNLNSFWSHESFCASSSCSLSPSMTNCGSERFKVEVLLTVFLHTVPLAFRNHQFTFLTG